MTAPQGRHKAPEDAIDFEEIWQYRDELRDMCQRIVGDAALADDLVQETYVQALRNIHRLERRDGLMPWLVTVARRRSLNELRRQRYATPVDVVPKRSTAVELDPGEVVSVTDEVVRVQSVLETLTVRERDLLMRQVYGGLSLHELAAEEDSTPASVRSVLSRARSKIKAAIADTGVAVLAPVTVLTRWVRHRFPTLRVRGPVHDPAQAASYNRLGEAITAGVASLALGVTTGIVPVFPSRPNDAPTTVDAGGAGSGGASEGGGAAAPAAAAAARRADGTLAERVTSRALTNGDATDAGAPSASPDAGSAEGQEEEGPGSNSSPIPEPGTPDPSPAPVEELPVDPAQPFPEANDPDDASYQQFASPSGGGDAGGGGGQGSGNGGTQGTSGGGGEGGDGSDEIFALGRTNGKCNVNCTALFHSADGGATWERVSATGLTGTSLLVAPAYPRDPRIYAAGPTGLQVSVDGGRNFEAVLTAPHNGPAAISPDFSSGDERILIGANPSGWEYDAASDTSQPVANGPSSSGGVTFAFTPDHRANQTLFAGAFTLDPEGSRATVHTCRGRLRDYACSRQVALEGLTGAPSMYVSSTYAEDKLVFAYGQGGFFRSANRGATFDPVAVPFEKVAALTDDGAGTVYAAGWQHDGDGTRGGVARSVDRGRTWNVLGAGTPLAEGVTTLAHVGGDRLLAAPLASAGGGMLCSVDGGSTWQARCPAPEAAD